MGKKFEGKSVLLVDDDRDILRAMEAGFEAEGASVATAGDGNTAVEKVLANPPDLLVLDMMLPKRSGFLVLERLSNEHLGEDKPKPHVIMITGNEGKRHEQYARAMGAEEYIRKPFAMGQLMEVAERLLGM